MSTNTSRNPIPSRGVRIVVPDPDMSVRQEGTYYTPDTVSRRRSSSCRAITLIRWDRSGWRRPGGMPCVVCREVVVDAVCATVHATDDYLRWASSHCARTPATANGDLARPPDPTLAQPKPAHRTIRTNRTCAIIKIDTRTICVQSGPCGCVSYSSFFLAFFVTKRE